MLLDKVRDHLEVVPAVRTSGPDSQDGHLSVGKAVAVFLDKVRDLLEKVATVPQGPDCQYGDLGSDAFVDAWIQEAINSDFLRQEWQFALEDYTKLARSDANNWLMHILEQNRRRN